MATPKIIPDSQVPLVLPGGLIAPVWYERLKLLFDALRTIDAAATFDKTTTATQTGLMLWDVDNATIERVTVGAADSGGAGFKVLRIPN